MARGARHTTVGEGPVEAPWALPKGWRWERLGDVADLVRGVSYNKQQVSAVCRDDLVPLLRGGNIQDGRIVLDDLVHVESGCVSPNQYVRKGDVLLTMSSGSPALVGKSGWADPPVSGLTFGAFCACLRSQKIEEARWVFWFLQTPFYRQRITGSAKGTNINNLKRNDLQALPIPMPPELEVVGLVARIDALFAELDEGERQLTSARRKVTTYRKALLKAAVNGELTADWRDDNPPSETGEDLRRRVLSDRRARWVAEPKVKKRDNDTSNAGEGGELDALPSSWVWIKVAQAGSIQLGRQRTPKDHAGPHMRPYLRVANVYEDRISVADVKMMNFTPGEFENFRLRYGDILLNEGQSLELVGRPAMYRNEVEDCCFQNTLIRFVSGDAVSSDYALLVFLNYLHSGRFQRIAKITTNIAHLGAGRLSDVEFPLPPLAEQQEIVRRYRLYRESTDELILKPSVLHGLRQSILAAAFRGDLVA